MLFILSIIFFPIIIFGETFECAGLNQQIKKDLRTSIHTIYTKAEINELNFEISGINPPKNCISFDYELPNFIALNRNVVLKIDIKTNNSKTERITKIITISGTASVYKTSKKVFRESIITNQNIYNTKVPISQLKRTMIGKETFIKNTQFISYSDEDKWLESWMISKIPDIKKGTLINGLYKNKNITLTLGGVILENGNIGDFVKFKSKGTNKIFSGTIHDKNTIIITRI